MPSQTLSAISENIKINIIVFLRAQITSLIEFFFFFSVLIHLIPDL